MAGRVILGPALMGLVVRGFLGTVSQEALPCPRARLARGAQASTCVAK